MEQLRINQRISLTDGRRGQVYQKLGAGGQGSVFMIDMDGEKKALKWYDKAPSERFITNLQKNIKDGPPSGPCLQEPLKRARHFASCMPADYLTRTLMMEDFSSIPRLGG